MILQGRFAIALCQPESQGWKRDLRREHHESYYDQHGDPVSSRCEHWSPFRRSVLVIDIAPKTLLGPLAVPLSLNVARHGSWLTIPLPPKAMALSWIVEVPCGEVALNPLRRSLTT